MEQDKNGVNDNSELNDIRTQPQFKGISFSGYTRTGLLLVRRVNMRRTFYGSMGNNHAFHR